MKPLKHQLTIAILLLTIAGFAQNNFSYAYDNAGNRITRKIITINGNKSAAAQDSSRKTEQYNDALGEMKITIYPNPTKGQLVMKIENLPDNTATRADVFDYSGRAICSVEKLTGYNTIDISSQAPGNYIMRIIAGDKVSSWTIVKQ